MIFLSYAREDHRIAEELTEELKDSGIFCFKDPVLPKSAPFWRDHIRDRLTSCSAMIALESDWAAASPWVDEERRAFDGPILSVAMGAGHTTSAGYISAPTQRRELVRIARRFESTTSQTNDGASESGGDDDTTSERRAATIQASTSWLESFRARIGRRRATLDWDGQVLVNRSDMSELRALRSDPDVYIGTAPISNAQYAQFLEAGGLSAPPTWSRDEYRHPAAPVTGITWYEASAYAAWAGGELPTEAEWEEAAAGYGDRVEYATATGAISRELAWFDRPFAEAAPRPSEDFPPNSAGFFGLCGNVWDWVETRWQEHRVVKGGGCMDAARFCRIGAKYRNAPVDRDCCVGFRIKIVRPDLS